METMKIYEIDEELEKCFDQETGEILDPEMFEQLQDAREHKIEGIGCIIKNRAALIDSMKAEKARLIDRINELEAKNKRTTAFLDYVLAGQKFETAQVRCTYRKSKSVNIEDVCLIPEEYKTEEVEIKPDKAAIKKAITDGKFVPGASLVENNNLSVR